MNPIAEEMKAILEGNDEELMHYGMPRRSGRYPWGSGEDAYQHNGDFLSRIENLKKDGWTETPENIKEAFGMTTTQYRTEKSLAKSERRALVVARAKSLREDGLGYTEIGRIMGENESTIRSYLNEKSETRMNKARNTADFLKKQIDEKGMIDVGAGVELEKEINVSKEKMKQALALIQEEGYPVYAGRVEQATNKGNWTTIKVACPPGTEHKDIFKAFDNGEVHTITDYISRDNGETFSKFVYPKSMDSKRLMIRYAEDGGINKDGIVELRRGVDDLSLGESRYSQVRILVDGKKYIKGMAVYSDDMPDGVDVVFNTNKTKDVAKMDVLKNIKDDPDNPFGSLIKEKGGQSYYIDKNGKEQLSLINKRADEGDWSDWKDKLPSQFLSKQPISLAKRQLNLAIADKVAEYESICEVNNPTIKKNLLKSFSDDCDSAAVHLQAAALPRQKYHVIIPINSLKDNEIYAPGYESGTKLALVRYPHGGIFEIPVLTVNNKNSLAKNIIGPKSVDAVGINKKIADQLSGADFDGDTVMCIPTHDPKGKVKIAHRDGLEGLEGFDPKTKYGYDKKTVDDDGTEHYYRNNREFRIMKNTGTEMGVISNLITDMTLKGADDTELAAAVRHSMVVIDAEKHKLDYKQSALDNNISALKAKYQKKENGRSGGASTLISRAKGETQVDKRQGSPYINRPGIKDRDGNDLYDPKRPLGSLIYKTADDVEYTVQKVNKRTGEVTTQTKRRHQPSTNMAETDDARTLISDFNTPMERAYADYANKMKSLANQARMEMVSTGNLKYDAKAKAVYQKEVDSLNAKLNNSLLNAPRERQAQLLTNAEIKAKQQANPDMTKSDIKKASQQALTKYRNAVGAKRELIKITDKEWEAIQSGAISENTLDKILKNADIDDLRQRATPRASNTLNKSQVTRIKNLSNSNYTIGEIAKKLGVSTATVSKYLKE